VALGRRSGGNPAWPAGPAGFRVQRGGSEYPPDGANARCRRSGANAAVVDRGARGGQNPGGGRDWPAGSAVGDTRIWPRHPNARPDGLNRELLFGGAPALLLERRIEALGKVTKIVTRLSQYRVLLNQFLNHPVAVFKRCRQFHGPWFFRMAGGRRPPGSLLSVSFRNNAGEAKIVQPP
jgi:hypothetical protein